MNWDRVNITLRFCREFFETHGHAPSQRQIAQALQVSVPTVQRCLCYLWGEGKLVKGGTVPIEWMADLRQTG